VTRLEAAVLVLTSFGAIVAGTALLGGLPWALIVGGGLGVLVSILLFDPTVKRRRKPRRTPEQRAAVRASVRAENLWNR
jgi:membrane protein implicated in regulation of membrane protease activity